MFVLRKGAEVFSEQVDAFLRRRRESIRGQKGGVRTSRHTFLNIRIDVADREATLLFTNVNYAMEGRPPVVGLDGPLAVSDCEANCRLDADGRWRLTRFATDLLLLREDLPLSRPDPGPS